MNDLNSTDELRIKHFVREDLGCSCPDEVFEDIRVSEHLDIFDFSNTVYEIGGRLVVAVLKSPDWRQLENKLEQLMEAGKQFRDQRGYNRFRLVVATDDAAAIDSLQATFNSLANVDDKSHLHILRPEVLPSYATFEPD